MDWEMGLRGKGEVTFLAHVPLALLQVTLLAFSSSNFPLFSSPSAPLQEGSSAELGRKAELLSTPHSAITSALGSPPAQFP